MFENQEAFCYAIILPNMHASPAAFLVLYSTAARGKSWNWTADNITPLTNLPPDGFLPETVFTEQGLNLEKQAHSLAEGKVIQALNIFAKKKCYYSSL